VILPTRREDECTIGWSPRLGRPIDNEANPGQFDLLQVVHPEGNVVWYLDYTSDIPPMERIYKSSNSTPTGDCLESVSSLKKSALRLALRFILL
jgi:hypothetical protein